MATNLLPPFRPATAVKAAASSDDAVPDLNSRRSSSSSSFSNWWTPLFGWSSQPDYIGSGNSDNKSKITYDKKPDFQGLSLTADGSKADRPVPKPGRSGASPSTVSFTEQKARLLRKVTSDAASLHDAMYHSAIASRLASDLGERSDT